MPKEIPQYLLDIISALSRRTVHPAVIMFCPKDYVDILDNPYLTEQHILRFDVSKNTLRFMGVPIRVNPRADVNYVCYPLLGSNIK